MRMTRTFVALAAVLAAAGTAGADKLINTPHFWQPTNWSCAPTSGQILIYAFGSGYRDMWTVNTVVGATSWGGANTPDIVRAVRHFTGQPFYTVYNFNRDLVVSNINRNAPVEINFRGDYMTYINQYLLHHSVIVGYTGGGFYIHDTAFGANKWASNTSVWNAVQYHYKIYAVKYPTISGDVAPGGTAIPPANYVMYRLKLGIGLNVHNGAGWNHPIAGTLPSGTVVDVYGFVGGWLKIWYRSSWQYIANLKTVKVGLSVQAMADLDVHTGSGVAGKLPKNAIVHCWQWSNGWYRIWWNGAWRWIWFAATRQA